MIYKLFVGDQQTPPIREKTVTIKPRSPDGLGGGAELLPGQGPYNHGGLQHGNRPLEEALVPTGCIFLGILQDGGSLGFFLTAPSLPQPTGMVEGLSGANPLIPVSQRPGIGHTYV